jgi:hypothetical protein
MDVYYPVDLGADSPSAIVMAAAPVAERERILGICYPVGNAYEGQGDMFSSSPGEDARRYFMKKGVDPNSLPLSQEIDDVHIVVQPEHGRLILVREKDGAWGLAYLPGVAGYFGKDRFEVLVQVDGKPVRIIYHMVLQPRMADGLTDSEFDKFCPAFEWIISAPSPENYNTPSSWYLATSLQSLLTARNKP